MHKRKHEGKKRRPGRGFQPGFRPGEMSDGQENREAGQFTRESESVSALSQEAVQGSPGVVGQSVETRLVGRPRKYADDRERARENSRAYRQRKALLASEKQAAYETPSEKRS